MATIVTTPFEYGSGTATSYSRTRSTPVGLGNVLVVNTWQYSAANTCTKVEDDLGNNYVLAGGPYQGPAGAGNPKEYVWVALNCKAGGTPTNGRVTATWSGSATGGISLGEASGLVGGGAVDQCYGQPGTSANGGTMTPGTSAPLAQAGEVGIAFLVSSVGNSGSTWPSVQNSAVWNYEFAQATTNAGAAGTVVTPAWTLTSGGAYVASVVFLKDGTASALAGPTAPNVAENSTSVGTYTCTTAGAWSLTGTDAARFVLTPAGDNLSATLAFSPAPNREVPMDAGANNVYNITVVCGAFSQAVAVTVTNVTELAGAPTGVVATPGNAQASVAFTAPVDNGSPAVAGYTVVSTPGNFTASGTSSPIVVSGLTNGTAYTFTVSAVNVDGTGPASAASAAVTPAVGPSAPTNTAAPKVSGLMRIGSQLVGGNGTWSGTVTGFTYQWWRNGVRVVGAVSATYTLAQIDEGADILYSVVAANGSLLSAEIFGNRLAKPLPASNLPAPIPISMGFDGKPSVLI